MSSSASSSVRSGARTGSQYQHTATSFRSRHSRSSPSPTRHYLQKQETALKMEEKLFEMNKFLYLGIDKFLDKQAVLDLIQQYDDEDLYPQKGIIDGEYFLPTDFETEDDGDANKKGGKFNGFELTVLNVLKSMKTSSNSNRNDQSTNESASVMTTLMALIRFKLFNIRKNSAKRKIEELDQLEGDDFVECFC